MFFFLLIDISLANLFKNLKGLRNNPWELSIGDTVREITQITESLNGVSYLLKLCKTDKKIIN